MSSRIGYTQLMILDVIYVFYFGTWYNWLDVLVQPVIYI